MKLFKASQQLVDLLLRNGFTDFTDKLYPHYYKRMNQAGYDPYSMKRIFCFNGTDDYLLFNYVYITLHHTGYFNHTEERHRLTEDELRSLITFYNLPPENGREWLEAYVNAFEVHKYYHTICALPELYNSLTDRLIREVYERIIIR
jgi:hypothetical protein